MDTKRLERLEKKFDLGQFFILVSGAIDALAIMMIVSELNYKTAMGAFFMLILGIVFMTIGRDLLEKYTNEIISEQQYESQFSSEKK